MRNPIMACITGILLLAAGCAASGESETVGEGFALLFPQDRVVEIQFVPNGGYDAMVEAYLGTGIPEYVRSSMDYDGEQVSTVGLRLRADTLGGTGKYEIKYSLKANFDYFGGTDFHQVDKIYLGNNKPDPSQMRARLTGLLFEAVGVVASRTAYAWVGVEGRTATLYTLVQDVDKRFLKDHFGSENGADDGNLYKCVPPGCTLVWNGDNKSDYVTECGEEGGCGLVLETNLEDPSKNDYSDLIDFVYALNETSDEEFEEAISAVFEVDEFLKVLAVMLVAGEFDSVLGSPDNFYLYHRPDTGRFQFIPWDHNKSFGSKACDNATHVTGSGVEQPWCDDSSRPLVTRILAVDAFRSQFESHVESILNTNFTLDRIGGWIGIIQGQISEFVDQDSESFTTSAEWEESLGYGGDEVAPMRLMEYVKQRREYLLSEIEASR